MYRNNRTTAVILEKFFIENLESLHAKVQQELEVLHRNPTERAIYRSLIDLHDVFSHFLGKINAFRHYPTYRSMFGHVQLDVQQQFVFLHLGILAAKLNDRTILPAHAHKRMAKTINNFLSNLKQENNNGYSSKAA